MKIKFNTGIILLVIAITSFAFKSEMEQVKGWFLAGSKPSSYEIGVVNDSERKGKVGFLKSKEKVKGGFGTIMQTFSSENYLGKKLKLSGYIKTQDVTGWVGMWMRVDGKEKGSLSFDNMGDRKIKGTTAWTKYEIILDVPKASTSINYGVLLDKTGTVWLDDLTFEEVKNDAKSTGRTMKMKPSNASFED